MIFLVLIIVAFLIASIFLFGTYIIFHFCPHLTEKTGATVVYKKHKKDVKIIISSSAYESNIDHLTKGIYEYKVGEKYYYKKDTFYYTTYNQAPYMIPIVYIKRFPKISYINSNTSLKDFPYLIWGIVVSFVGVFMPLFIIILSLFF